MSEERLSRALDDSLRAIRDGATVQQCLSRYRDLAAELAPLLASAGRLMLEPVIALPADRRAVSRSLLMAAIAAEPVRRSVPLVLPMGLPAPRIRWHRLSYVPLAAFALIVVAIVFASGTAHSPQPSEMPSVLTVLQGDVLIETPSGVLAAATNGLELRPGDRITTGPGSRAVVTFFDGSTVTLDQDTVVVIRSQSDEAGQLHAVLEQSQGSTWTHIPQDLGPAQIEIDTPSARVQTNDASFATTVQGDGRTQVDSQSGALALSSSGGRTEVSGGQQASAETSGSVGAASAADKPQRELIVRISGPVYAFLTDPNGATVGTLDPGVPVNQVNGATASREGADLVLRLPEPADGAYRLGLSAAGSGSVSIVGTLRNGTGSDASRSFAVGQGENWRVGITLSSDQVAVGNAERTSQDVKPDVVTVPDRAAEKAKNQTQLQPAAPTETSTVAPRPSSTPTATSTQPAKPTSTPTTRPLATATPRVIATAAPIKPEATDQLAPGPSRSNTTSPDSVR